MKNAILALMLCTSVVGCGAMFASSAVLDANAFKSAKRVLVNDVYFVDSYSYYKESALCADVGYAKWPRATDAVKSAFATRFEVGYSQKLQEEYAKVASPHLKTGCVDGLSMIPTASKNWIDDEEGRLSFMNLVAKAGEQVGTPYDLTTRTTVNFTFTDNCTHPDYKKDPNCAARSSALVSATLQVFDVAGKRNQLAFLVTKMEVVPELQGVKPSMYEKLPEDKKPAVDAAAEKAVGAALAEMVEKIKDIVKENKSVPPPADIDAKLSF